MDYQAVLRRKKDEEQRYRDINDIGNYDESAGRGFQGTWNTGGPYPLRKSRSAEIQENSRVGSTPHPFLTPSPHMLVPGAGQRSSRFNQDSGPGQYLPSFGDSKQKRNTILEDESLQANISSNLPWEQRAARIESIAGGASQGALASVQGSGQPGNGPSNSYRFQAQESVLVSKKGNAQEEYRLQLQKQIEEQRRMKEMRKAQEREEEEKLERRAEEQRMRIQKEMEEEATMRKMREQKIQQKQDFLVKKQEEFAAAASLERRNAQKLHINTNQPEQNSIGHRGWTPAPPTKFTNVVQQGLPTLEPPKVQNEIGHRGWTPAPEAKISKAAQQGLLHTEPMQVQNVQKEIGHRGWTPAPNLEPTKIQPVQNGTGWTPASNVEPTKVQLVQNDTGHRGCTPALATSWKRGWTPPSVQDIHANIQNQAEHRGWTPSCNHTDVTSFQEVKDAQKNLVHKGFTSTTATLTRSSLPVTESSAVPTSQVREPQKFMNLSPSVLDEIAQLRERLRSEHKKQDELLQRYYRILSHQFFDD